MTQSQEHIAQSLLEERGRTYASEIGIDLDANDPSALFELLCSSLLFSTRISADIAVSAARALFDEGWTTPQKMIEATWRERTDVLNRSGYARYDESTSSMLGETCEALIDRYDADLRILREHAERDPTQERRLLKGFKGIGDTGADIFFREIQLQWPELYPFVDKKAREGAEKAGLVPDPESLKELVDRTDFPRLVAALVRLRVGG